MVRIANEFVVKRGKVSMEEKLTPDEWALCHQVPWIGDKEADAMERVAVIKALPKCKCGGSFVVDDPIWRSRIHCDKCGDYCDLSG
jgi:hypothetical protein